MGEVYKARDTRLDRSVAIKVLPEHIAQREEARARFEREARAVASLNHPNICTLHDIGPNYMVMELIEGETMAARIAKGPIPLEQAISYAVQIGDALDRAHRAGVTHRDVKPQNIMVTRDGVKVLDFGLAKSGGRTGPTEETLTKVLTTEGTMMGTPQYMAPEQFEGREADARSDIWAFGAVVYEMVTGRKAFEGKSYSSLVGAILSADPAPMAMQPFTPAWLERLVRRCLQKDPEDRFQSMRDLVIDLKAPPIEAMAGSKSNRWLWVAATVLLFVAVIFAGLWMRGKGMDPGVTVATVVGPPEGSTFSRMGNIGGSAISPDGRTLAFVATSDKGEALLYVRPLESLTARALAGSENASRPFWSPDSKSLAFFAGGKLKRIDLAGGSAVSLCDAAVGRGGDWNEAGMIVFARQVEGILQIPASGGTPTPVTRVNRTAGEIFHYYPQFLPGGRQFLYLVRHNDPTRTGIAVGSLDGGSADGKTGEAIANVIMSRTEFSARYDAATGKLVYLQGEGTLLAQRMEGSPPRMAGEPIQVADGVRTARTNGYADFSFSRNGILFYRQGAGESKVRLGWRDRSGKPLETIGEPFPTGGTLSSFSLSPDGTRVVYQSRIAGGADDIFVMDLGRGLRTRISFSGGSSPRWSPDGRFLYYSNATGITRKPADGSGEGTLLLKDGSFVTTVSPDGKALLFGVTEIQKLPLIAGAAAGEATPEAFLKANYSNGQAAFSPDGRWMAYRSYEPGRNEIFIQGYPDKRGKWQVSNSGGNWPAWRADGKELYWTTTDGTVNAAEIELGPEGVRIGRPQALFRVPETDTFPYCQPSRDGQRFLVYEPETGASQEVRMVLVQNWAGRLGK